MKLAIAGTGMIVGEALQALRYVQEIEVTAIFSRPQSITKARQLANQYHIASIYTDYDKMLKHGDADFVYIANINSVHYEYGRKALLAGKHLIIEKPMCVTEAEAESLAALAHESHLYVFEALTFLHAPFFAQLKQELLPQIGRIRLIQCNYSKYSSRYDRYLKHDVAPVFSPECAGGTLLDLNIYNLNFVASLFGEPAYVRYFANKGYNGIDTSGTAILQYTDFIATCNAAKDSYSPCFDIIQGEKGWLRIDGSPDNLEKLEISVSGKSQVVSISPANHRMVDEFRAFEQIYRSNDYQQMNHFLSHSLLIARIAEKALKSI